MNSFFKVSERSIQLHKKYILVTFQYYINLLDLLGLINILVTECKIVTVKTESFTFIFIFFHKNK